MATDQTHPQRSTVGAQFPSKHTTPAQSTHNMETAIQDRSAERPPSTYCDAETQTDHVQLVSISSPTPPPKSPARSVSPGNGATQVTRAQAKTPASSPRSKSAAVRRRSPTTTNGTATVGIGGNLSTKSSVTLGQHYASRPATRSRQCQGMWITTEDGYRGIDTMTTMATFASVQAFDCISIALSSSF